MQQRGVAMESWGSFAEGKNNLFSNETLCAIGERHHKSAAQVTLRWLVQRGIICIPKSVHQERIEANIDIFDFSLTDEEMAQIAAMDTGRSSFLSHYDPETVSWLGNVKYDI